jgi:hypothetical protein
MRVVVDTSVLIGDAAPSTVDAASASYQSPSCISAFSWQRMPMSERGASVGSQPSRQHSSRCRSRSTWAGNGAGWRRLLKPRRRQLDLAIAATAVVERVPLLTYNTADFKIINDLVDAREP